MASTAGPSHRPSPPFPNVTHMWLTTAQVDSLKLASYLCCAISLATLLPLLTWNCAIKEKRRFPSRLVTHTLFVAAMFHCSQIVGMAVGFNYDEEAAKQYAAASAGKHEASLFCMLQGVGFQYFASCLVLFYGVLVFVLHSVVVKGLPFQRLQPLEPRLLFLCYAVPAVLTAVPFSMRPPSPQPGQLQWCWLTPEDSFLWQWLFFYAQMGIITVGGLVHSIIITAKLARLRGRFHSFKRRRRRSAAQTHKGGEATTAGGADLRAELLAQRGNGNGNGNGRRGRGRAATDAGAARLPQHRGPSHVRSWTADANHLGLAQLVNVPPRPAGASAVDVDVDVHVSSPSAAASSSSPWAWRARSRSQGGTTVTNSEAPGSVITISTTPDSSWSTVSVLASGRHGGGGGGGSGGGGGFAFDSRSPSTADEDGGHGHGAYHVHDGAGAGTGTAAQVRKALLFHEWDVNAPRGGYRENIFDVDEDEDEDEERGAEYPAAAAAAGRGRGGGGGGGDDEEWAAAQVWGDYLVRHALFSGLFTAVFGVLVSCAINDALALNNIAGAEVTFSSCLLQVIASTLSGFMLVAVFAPSVQNRKIVATCCCSRRRRGRQAADQLTEFVG